eukprot:15478318-Alexandrium_andersonii.AAC.1
MLSGHVKECEAATHGVVLRLSAAQLHARDAIAVGPRHGRRAVPPAFCLDHLVDILVDALLPVGGLQALHVGAALGVVLELFLQKGICIRASGEGKHQGAFAISNLGLQPPIPRLSD